MISVLNHSFNSLAPYQSPPGWMLLGRELIKTLMVPLLKTSVFRIMAVLIYTSSIDPSRRHAYYPIVQYVSCCQYLVPVLCS